jgi:hypothetical protein
MLQENEFIGLFMGVCLLVYLGANRPRLAGLPSVTVLLASFNSLLVAWALTVLQEYWSWEAVTLFEHVFYALSALLLAVWCWRVFGLRKAGP